MTFLEWAIAHDACHCAITWIKDQPKQDVESLWNNCTHPDWMLWAHERVGTESVAGALSQVRYMLASSCMKSIIQSAQAAEFSVPEGANATITDDDSLASAVIMAKRICKMAEEEEVQTRSQRLEWSNMTMKENLMVTLSQEKKYISRLITPCRSHKEDFSPEGLADFIRCNMPPPKIKLD